MVAKPSRIILLFISYTILHNACKKADNYQVFLHYTVAIFPGLPPIDNAIFDYNTMESLLTNETVAIYTCNDGFSLDGNANRICDTGKWTGVEPMCIESISPY